MIVSNVHTSRRFCRWSVVISGLIAYFIRYKCVRVRIYLSGVPVKAKVIARMFCLLSDVSSIVVSRIEILHSHCESGECKVQRNVNDSYIHSGDSKRDWRAVHFPLDVEIQFGEIISGKNIIALRVRACTWRLPHNRERPVESAVSVVIPGCNTLVNKFNYLFIIKICMYNCDST